MRLSEVGLKLYLAVWPESKPSLARRPEPLPLLHWLKVAYWCPLVAADHLTEATAARTRANKLELSPRPDVCRQLAAHRLTVRRHCLLYCCSG